MKKQRKFPATTGAREQRKVDLAAMRRRAAAHGDWKIEADLARIEANKLERVIDNQRRPLLEAAKPANEKSKAAAAAEHERWRAKAAEIRAEQPDLNKSAIARRVIHRLRLDDKQFRNVRRHI